MPAVAAQARTITVNTIADTSPTQCTLRDAIKAANTDMASNGCTTPGSGTDAIQFALPNPSTITLGSALDQIATDVDIQGPGASQLTVSGNSNYRIFRIALGTTVSISGAALTDGTVAGTDCALGAGILNEGTLSLDRVVVSGNDATGTDSGTAGGCAEGAGIWSDIGATLTLDHSTVTDNHTIASATGATHQGLATSAGINNGGTLIVNESTVSDNTNHVSLTGGATAFAPGAGIRTYGSATLINSTVANNGVITPGGQGGGIWASTSTTLRNDTISQNVASVSPGDGGNLFIANSTTDVTAKNTIVADPLSSGNCGGDGFPTSLGNDLSFDSGGDTYPCFNAGNGNVFGDPMLGPLQDNGGPTNTEAIGSGSAALNSGSACEPIDQRGLFRGGAAGPCDIGAFEFGATVSPPPPGASTPGTTASTGQRAAALKKCKHKHGRKRKKCKKKAKLLPV